MPDTIPEYFARFSNHFYYEPWRSNDWRQQEQFNALAQIMEWSQDERKAEHIKFQNSWASVVDEEFAGDTLSDYQQLCEELRILPVPDSKTECERRLARVNVNMVDFVQYRIDKKAGREPGPVQTFETFEELENYRKRTQKTYPLRNAHARTLKVLLKVIRETSL